MTVVASLQAREPLCRGEWSVCQGLRRIITSIPYQSTVFSSSYKTKQKTVHQIATSRCNPALNFTSTQRKGHGTISYPLSPPNIIFIPSREIRHTKSPLHPLPPTPYLHSPLLGLKESLIGSALGCACPCPWLCILPLIAEELRPKEACLLFRLKEPTSCFPTSPLAIVHSLLLVWGSLPSQHALTFSTRSASLSCLSIIARKSSALSLTTLAL